ncbi:MAG: ROK family protein [Candidatus Bathyarchaeia archaeon]
MKKYGLGVDIGATNLRVAIGDETGRILSKLIEETDRSQDPTAISRQIARMIKSLCKSLNLSFEEVVGIGIGSIGPLNLKRGGIEQPANIPGVGFVPIVEPLKEEFKLPVVLLNDCVAAVMGEKFYGDGGSVENLVYITISTGIGAGVYVNGNLLLGKDGNAHEIGHIVIDFDGRLVCGCGRRGHWEAYCSGRNIPNYVKYLVENNLIFGFEKSLPYKLTRGELSRISARMIYESAKQADRFSLEVVRRIGVLNAIGFASVINVYDPELITVGGSVMLHNSELILPFILQHVGEYSINRIPEMKLTTLKDEIVLYGAIASAFNPPEVYQRIAGV